jgi:hypothetical protein
MHIDKFMPILLDKASIVARPHVFSWKVRKKYAALTGLIDCGCAFTKKSGCCRQYRKRYNNNKRAVRVCCGSCAEEVGWLEQLPPDWDMIRAMAKNFSKVHGFWKAGVGCTMSRKIRSNACLQYTCYMNRGGNNLTLEQKLVKFFAQPKNFEYKFWPTEGLYRNEDKYLPSPEELKDILIERRKK